MNNKQEILLYTLVLTIIIGVKFAYGKATWYEIAFLIIVYIASLIYVFAVILEKYIDSHSLRLLKKSYQMLEMLYNERKKNMITGNYESISKLNNQIQYICNLLLDSYDSLVKDEVLVNQNQDEVNQIIEIVEKTKKILKEIEP